MCRKTELVAHFYHTFGHNKYGLPIEGFGVIAIYLDRDDFDNWIKTCPALDEHYVDNEVRNGVRNKLNSYAGSEEVCKDALVPSTFNVNPIDSNRSGRWQIVGRDGMLFDRLNTTHIKMKADLQRTLDTFKGVYDSGEFSGLPFEDQRKVDISLEILEDHIYSFDSAMDRIVRRFASVQDVMQSNKVDLISKTPSKLITKHTDD